MIRSPRKRFPTDWSVCSHPVINRIRFRTGCPIPESVFHQSLLGISEWHESADCTWSDYDDSIHADWSYPGRKGRECTSRSHFPGYVAALPSINRFHQPAVHRFTEFLIQTSVDECSQSHSFSHPGGSHLGQAPRDCQFTDADCFHDWMGYHGPCSIPSGHHIRNVLGLRDHIQHHGQFICHFIIDVLRNVQRTQAFGCLSPKRSMSWTITA